MSRCWQGSLTLVENVGKQHSALVMDSILHQLLDISVQQGQLFQKLAHGFCTAMQELLSLKQTSPGSHGPPPCPCPQCPVSADETHRRRPRFSQHFSWVRRSGPTTHSPWPKWRTKIYSRRKSWPPVGLSPTKLNLSSTTGTTSWGRSPRHRQTGFSSSLGDGSNLTS